LSTSVVCLCLENHSSRDISLIAPTWIFPGYLQGAGSKNSCPRLATKWILKASGPTCYHELTSKIIHYSSACWRDFRKYVANHNSWRAQSSYLDGLYRSKIQPLLLHPALIYAQPCDIKLASSLCRNTTFSIYQISLQDKASIKGSERFSCATVYCGWERSTIC